MSIFTDFLNHLRDPSKLNELKPQLFLGAKRMAYSLTLNIGDEDLETIRGVCQKIAVSKPVLNASAYSDEVEVIWLVLEPISKNVLQWTDDYWPYTSATSTKINGSKIRELSVVSPGPAEIGMSYPFTKNATFSETPTPISPANNKAFGIINHYMNKDYPALTFGLSQKAIINGTACDPTPISAHSIPPTLVPGKELIITPMASVQIWLEENFERGTILTEDISKKATAKFDRKVTDISMTYDHKFNLFIRDPD